MILFVVIMGFHQINSLFDFSLAFLQNWCLFFRLWPIIRIVFRIVYVDATLFKEQKLSSICVGIQVSQFQDDLSNTPGVQDACTILSTVAKATAATAVNNDDDDEEKKKLEMCMAELTISLFSKWLNNSNSRRIYRHPSKYNLNHRSHNIGFPLASVMKKTVISIHVTSHNVNKSYNTQSLNQVSLTHTEQKKNNTHLFIGFFPLNILWVFFSVERALSLFLFVFFRCVLSVTQRAHNRHISFSKIFSSSLRLFST